VNITAATASTYTANKATAQSHAYNCTVTGAGCTGGTADTTPSTGTWVAPPTTVAVTPTGTTTVCAGNNIVYTATVTGGSGLTYQWTEDTVNIAGATLSTYTANKATAQSHAYNCQVSSTGCATAIQDTTPSTGTWTAAHTVDVTPNGTTTVCTTASILYTATVTGAVSPAYQWTEDGINVTGATTATYSVSKATAQTHTYNCNVTASGCVVADPAGAVGTWVAPPTVAITPSGTTTVCTGTNIVFTAGLTGGTSPFSYQWTQDGTNITGATASTYTVTFASAATHTYNCNVSSTGCATTAQDATPSAGTWKAPPTVSFTDTPDPSNVSQSVAFTSTVTGGTTTFAYDWNWGDATAHGTTASPSHTYSAGGSYTVILTVTDGAGCVVVVSNPHSVTIPAGSCSSTTLFSDNFESGTANWSLAGGTNPWAASTTAAGSPTTSIDGADPNTNGGRSKCAFAQMVSDIPLPSTGGALMLSFWSQAALAADDNGIVEISTDAAATWNKLTSVPYPASATTIGAATCPALAIAVADPVFAGTIAGTTYRANITSFATQSIRVRFTMVTGATKSASSHWYVDDVSITNEIGAAPGPVLSTGTKATGDDALDCWNKTTGGGNVTWTIGWGHVTNSSKYRIYRSTLANATAGTGIWAAGATAVPAGWTQIGADVIDSASPAGSDTIASTDATAYVYHVDSIGLGTCYVENYTQP